MVNNIAVSITTFIFNRLMLKYAGEAGVAAITVVLYAQFLMTSAFMGFSGGVAPVISYNYGRRNDAQLRKIFRISMGAVTAASVLVFAFSELFSSVVIGVFASPGSEVFRLAKHGFAVFGVNFLFAGLNIYASGMFTAFSDGLVSAVISFLRTLVFLVVSLLILPMLLDIDGRVASRPRRRGPGLHCVGLLSREPAKEIPLRRQNGLNQNPAPSNRLGPGFLFYLPSSIEARSMYSS